MHPTNKRKDCDSCGKPIEVVKGRGSLSVYLWGPQGETTHTFRDFCGPCTFKILLPGMARTNPNESPALAKRVPQKKNSNLDHYNPVAEQDIP